ncbi:hypothetical protein WJX77_011545 [Trebouxia sp. C0004]
MFSMSALAASSCKGVGLLSSSLFATGITSLIRLGMDQPCCPESSACVTKPSAWRLLGRHQIKSFQNHVHPPIEVCWQTDGMHALQLQLFLVRESAGQRWYAGTPSRAASPEVSSSAIGALHQVHAVKRRHQRCCSHQAVTRWAVLRPLEVVLNTRQPSLQLILTL